MQALAQPVPINPIFMINTSGIKIESRFLASVDFQSLGVG